MDFKGFLLWTVICILALTMVLIPITEAQYFNESPAKVTIGSSEKIFVNAEKASFSAVAKEYFVLWCPGSEAITPTQEEPPLGWQYDKYFVFHQAPIPTRIWCSVEVGENIWASTTIDGGKVIVDLQDDRELDLIILVSVVAAIIWIVVTLILTRPPSSSSPRRPTR